MIAMAPADRDRQPAYDPAAGRLFGTAQQGGWYEQGAAVRLHDGRTLFVGFGTEIYTRVRR
jgi:hypothetical protein